VEVRLAHEQGLLSQRKLNRFQHFALMYWLYLTRRDAIEKMRDELEVQCFNLSFERWEQLYRGTPDSVFTKPAAEDDEIPVTDIDELNRWYDQVAASRTMTGAHQPPQPQGWGEWQ
jgi:hypothetical protein